jgi:hypothetical protein
MISSAGLKVFRLGLSSKMQTNKSSIYFSTFSKLCKTSQWDKRHNGQRYYEQHQDERHDNESRYNESRYNESRYNESRYNETRYNERWFLNSTTFGLTAAVAFALTSTTTSAEEEKEEKEKKSKIFKEAGVRKEGLPDFR